MYERDEVSFTLQNNLTPVHLQELLPQKVGDVVPYGLRFSDKYRPNSFRTTFCQSSFMFDTVAEWNKLPSDLRACKSLSIFKMMLKKHIYVNQNELVTAYTNARGPGTKGMA